MRLVASYRLRKNWGSRISPIAKPPSVAHHCAWLEGRLQCLLQNLRELIRSRFLASWLGCRTSSLSIRYPESSQIDANKTSSDRLQLPWVTGQLNDVVRVLLPEAEQIRGIRIVGIEHIVHEQRDGEAKPVAWSACLALD